jgi:hypothetical protein
MNSPDPQLGSRIDNGVALFTNGSAAFKTAFLIEPGVKKIPCSFFSDGVNFAVKV